MEEQPEKEEKVQAQFLALVPIIQVIMPIIWQSFIEAIVFFFTTIGLEAWWKKEENKKEKK